MKFQILGSILFILPSLSQARVAGSQYPIFLNSKTPYEKYICPNKDVVACLPDDFTEVNHCCVPDQGHLTLALQWLPGYCKNAGRNKPCKKGTLKKVERNTWSLHGLWPGNCDGKTYLTDCRPERTEKDIEGAIRQKDSDLLEEMEKIWLSGNPDPSKDNNWFWAHEWNKHGQCISTITEECVGSSYKKNDDIVKYFERATQLRATFDLYPVLERANIIPTETDGYGLDELQNAFKQAFNNTQPEINCVYNKHERKQYMSEVRLCFHAKNKFDVEGPIDCLKPFSRCNPRYKVFYPPNLSKPRKPIPTPSSSSQQPLTTSSKTEERNEVKTEDENLIYELDEEKNDNSIQSEKEDIILGYDEDYEYSDNSEEEEENNNKIDEEKEEEKIKSLMEGREDDFFSDEMNEEEYDDDEEEDDDNYNDDEFNVDDNEESIVEKVMDIDVVFNSVYENFDLQIIASIVPPQKINDFVDFLQKGKNGDFDQIERKTMTSEEIIEMDEMIDNLLMVYKIILKEKMSYLQLN